MELSERCSEIGYSVVAGISEKVIKRYDFDKEKWVRV